MKKLVFAVALIIANLSINAQGKTVYVSTDEVFARIPQVKVVDSLVNKEGEKLSAMYDDRKTELNDLVALFIKDSSAMTNEAKEVKRKSLQEKVAALSTYEQQLKGSLEEYKEKQLEPVRGKVFETIKNIAKAKAATTVLYRESAVIIPTGSDITLEVVKKLGGK
jgi:outer membrane protein